MKSKLHLKRLKKRAALKKSSQAAPESGAPSASKWPSLQELRFKLKDVSPGTGCPYHFDRAF
jgi:hypothetical protein